MKYNENGIMEQSKGDVKNISYSSKVKVVKYKTKYKDYHKHIERTREGTKVLVNQEIPTTDRWLESDDFDRIFMSTIKVWDYDTKSERWRERNLKDSRGVMGQVKKITVSKKSYNELDGKYQTPPRRKLDYYE